MHCGGIFLEIYCIMAIQDDKAGYIFGIGYDYTNSLTGHESHEIFMIFLVIAAIVAIFYGIG